MTSTENTASFCWTALIYDMKYPGIATAVCPYCSTVSSVQRSGRRSDVSGQAEYSVTQSCQHLCRQKTNPFLAWVTGTSVRWSSEGDFHTQALTNVHVFKIRTEFFDAIKEGRKTAEYRRIDDRDTPYAGDGIALVEVDAQGEYTDRSLRGRITHVLTHEDLPELPRGYAVLSFAHLHEGSALQVRLQEALAVKRKKKQDRKPTYEPRYDDIYHEGVEALFGDSDERKEEA